VLGKRQTGYRPVLAWLSEQEGSVEAMQRADRELLRGVVARAEGLIRVGSAK
jgi:hypothetical protein